MARPQQSGVCALQVVCRVKRIGGGFGGKETRNVFIACAVAVPAYNLNRPVRLIVDRNVDMAITGQRHPFKAFYKVQKKFLLLALVVQNMSSFQRVTLWADWNTVD